MMITAPAELAGRPQWVAWRLVHRPGEPKPTKVPINARSGQHASTTDPSTWSSYVEANAYLSSGHATGIGYVLSEADPYTGVDLDDCREPGAGTVEAWAKQVIHRLHSYTEISPSGTGIRIFVVAELPPFGRHKGPIEVYSRARFLTITGDRYMAAPATIEARQDELLAWHREVFGDGRPPVAVPRAARSPNDLADTELLQKAHSANNGGKFVALWNGDFSAYPTQSEADLALVNYLAFWAGPDPYRIDALFRLSGLYREKWEQREDYRNWTIGKALEGRTDFYDPAYRSSNGAPHLIVPPHVATPPPEPGVSRAKTITELMQEPRTGNTRQLVEHLIWEGKTHWWYSSPGAGKTMLGLAALLHMAAGRSFCGLSVVQGAVMVIEEDSSESVFREYLELLAEIYEIELIGLPFYFNRMRGLRLRDKAGLEYALALVADAPTKPLVCLIDACERLVPSENFNSGELDPLAQLFSTNITNNIANIMIDHTRKLPTGAITNVDVIDLLYGGRTKSAISDIMMYFSGAIKNRAMVSFPKFRGEEPTGLQVSFDGAAGFAIKAGALKLTETERQVMMTITNSFAEPIGREDIGTRAKLPQRTTLRALNKLMDIGWVTRLGDGRETKYVATANAPGLFS